MVSFHYPVCQLSSTAIVVTSRQKEVFASPAVLVMAVLSSFDPLAPNATPSSSKHTFHTLERERLNRHPKTTGPDHPALDELAKPHIESFNALIEDSTGTGKGLLQLGVEDIGKRVVFDGKREDGTYGNRLSCALSALKRRALIGLN